jgi:hypothetical protein
MIPIILGIREWKIIRSQSEDSGFEVIKITESKRNTFNDFDFIVQAFNEPIIVSRINERIAYFSKPIIVCLCDIEIFRNARALQPLNE